MQICEAPGCKKRVIAKNLCPTHYKRLSRGGDPLAPSRVKFPGYVRINGTQVMAPVAYALIAEAEARGVSLYTHVTELINAWLVQGGQLDAKVTVPDMRKGNLEHLPAIVINPKTIDLLNVNAEKSGMSLYFYVATYLEQRFIKSGGKLDKQT